MKVGVKTTGFFVSDATYNGTQLQHDGDRRNNCEFRRENKPGKRQPIKFRIGKNGKSDELILILNPGGDQIQLFEVLENILRTSYLL